MTEPMGDERLAHFESLAQAWPDSAEPHVDTYQRVIVECVAEIRRLREIEQQQHEKWCRLSSQFREVCAELVRERVAAVSTRSKIFVAEQRIAELEEYQEWAIKEKCDDEDRIAELEGELYKLGKESE